MAEVTQSDLLPCPVCGMEPSSDPHETAVACYHSEQGWNIFCEECGAAGRICLEKADAIDAWNTLHRTEAVKPLVEALTPSGATQAAYIGEFHFNYTVWDPTGEEEIVHRVQVPWTTIKEIMAAILNRAALRSAQQ